MQIATFSMCEDLAYALGQELENAINRKIKLFPIIGIDPPIAYTEGVKLIRDAKYRLIISQRTSCLFLGPRNGVMHEQIFLKNTSRDKFIFRASDEFNAISHVIGDTGLGFNFFVGNNRYYLFLPCFLTKDQELQQLIANVQGLGVQQNWNDIKRMYNQMGIN